MSAEFMQRAISLALENVRSGRGGPFAALVVKDGLVIAQGTNLVTATNDPTAHAEVVAIREACRALADFQLSGCDLYTTCEPCPMCLGAIYWARPAQLFYAGRDVGLGFSGTYEGDRAEVYGFSNVGRRTVSVHLKIWKLADA